MHKSFVLSFKEIEPMYKSFEHRYKYYISTKGMNFKKETSLRYLHHLKLD